jgi:hypothetical protein
MSGDASNMTRKHKGSKSMNFLIKAGSVIKLEEQRISPNQDSMKPIIETVGKIDVPNLIFRYKMSNPDSFRHPHDLTNRPQTWKSITKQQSKPNLGDSIVIREKQSLIRKLFFTQESKFKAILDEQENQRMEFMNTISHLGFTQTLSKPENSRAMITAGTTMIQERSKPPSMENLSAVNKASKLGQRRKAYDRLSYNEDKIFRAVEKSRQKSLEYLRLNIPISHTSSGSRKSAKSPDAIDWTHEVDFKGSMYPNEQQTRNSADFRNTHTSNQSSAMSYTAGFKSASHALANLKYKTEQVSQKANPLAPASQTTATSKTFYKVPYKDFYFQSMVSKKASSKQVDFERVMGLKIANSLKTVHEILSKTPGLQNKSLIKIMLLVVGYTQHKVAGLITPPQPNLRKRSSASSRVSNAPDIHPRDVPQIVYLEKTLSIKTIVEYYVNIYLKSDKYSFGFSPENNQVLVNRVITFLINVNQKILMLRCKEHTDLFDRFEELEKYKRKDCQLEKPAVHLLDSSEGRLVQYLFLHFKPDLKQFSEFSANNQIADLDNMDFHSPHKRSATGELIPGRDDSSSEESARTGTVQGYKKPHKSKWLQMIEKCLATKDIMKASPEEFEGVFEQFVDKRRLAEYTKSHSFGNREGKTSESITKFRNLLAFQIQEERSDLLISRGYDD